MIGFGCLGFFGGAKSDLVKSDSLVVWFVRVGMVCFWAVNVLVVWDGHFSLLKNFTIQGDNPLPEV